MCGEPIYHYDHMIEYQDVLEHNEHNLTLLCGSHHDRKTRGLLPLMVVREADAHPYNIRKGVSAPHPLYYSGPTCTVDVGSNKFTMSTADRSAASAIAIDGRNLVGVRFEDGHALLDIWLYDLSNQPVLRVEDNELQFSLKAWDVEHEGKRFVFRGGRGLIFLDIIFDPANALLRINRGHLLLNGVELYVRPDYVLVVNSGQIVQECEAWDVPIGLSVGHDPYRRPAGFGLGNLPRYNVDRAAAFRQAGAMLRDLRLG